MKIELHDNDTPTNEYSIYKLGSKSSMRNFRRNITGLHGFSEQDIRNLLTDHQYNLFACGDQCAFDVPVNLLKLITGERSPQTKYELELYPNN